MSPLGYSAAIHTRRTPKRFSPAAQRGRICTVLLRLLAEKYKHARVALMRSSPLISHREIISPYPPLPPRYPSHRCSFTSFYYARSRHSLYPYGFYMLLLPRPRYFRKLNGLVFISGLRGLMGSANKSSSVSLLCVAGGAAAACWVSLWPPPRTASSDATPPPPVLPLLSGGGGLGRDRCGTCCCAKRLPRTCKYVGCELERDGVLG